MLEHESEDQYKPDCGFTVKSAQSSSDPSKHLTINYGPMGEAADEKEQVISCWAAVLH